MLLATMLNYMDRQALAQQATEISRDLQLSNEDYGRIESGFGLAFAVGGHRHGAHRRSVQPALALPGSCSWAGRPWGSRPAGSPVTASCSSAGSLLGFFEAGQWPCALVTSQRLLSRRDRPLGNSILQSGASLGAIATPVVVIALDDRCRR